MNDITDLDLQVATTAAIEAAREDLLRYILLIDPTFSVGPHHRILCDNLMQLYRGEIDRLMFFLPPRASKSRITSIFFPSWVYGKRPDWHLIGVSHSDELAVYFARNVRNLIQTPAYQAIFPRTRIRPDIRAADEWATTDGGEFTAAGVGTGIAGRGAHIASIDDPLSEQDAWSETTRNDVNEWYSGGLRPRLMPGGKVCLTQTRWHENDLAGFLLSRENDVDADQWTVARFPALNTPASVSLLNAAREKLIQQGLLTTAYPTLEENESFWPAASNKVNKFHWPTKELIRTRANMPDYQWLAVYMQTPTTPGSGILPAGLWRNWDNKHWPEFDYIFMSMDTAFSSKDRASYSAATIWGVFNPPDAPQTGEILPNLLLIDAQRGHWTYPQLKEKTTELFQTYHPQIIVIEKKASGQSLAQDLQSSYYPVYPFSVERDKEARAHACADFFKKGRIWAPRTKPFAREVINECDIFPHGPHTDYVDTVTQAILYIHQGGFLSYADPEYEADREQSSRALRARRKYY